MYPFIQKRIAVKPHEYPYCISGDFPIIDPEGTDWGKYSANILFHNTYPKGFALLMDKSKAFPWNLDWHIDEKNGWCCVCSPLESIGKVMTRISIVEFIREYVIRFYANQIFRKEFGYYKNGEYSHHQEGRWEALENEFSTSDRQEVKQILIRMAEKRRRKDPCFCGSTKPFNKCHQHRVKYIKALLETMTIST